MNEKIVVLGGAFQGKGNFVRQQFGIEKQDMITSLSQLKKAIKEKKNPLVVNGFHAVIGEAVSAHENMEFLSHWMEEDDFMQGSWIVISDEVGCGVVPVSREQRSIREETGRLLCRFSAQADKVIRVIAGIPTQIK